MLGTLCLGLIGLTFAVCGGAMLAAWPALRWLHRVYFLPMLLAGLAVSNQAAATAAGRMVAGSGRGILAGWYEVATDAFLRTTVPLFMLLYGVARFADLLRGREADRTSLMPGGLPDGGDPIRPLRTAASGRASEHRRYDDEVR